MEALIHIETYTVAAYRAIRPAIVASGIGYFGVSGLLISARIKTKDYSYLVAVKGIKTKNTKPKIKNADFVLVTE